MTTNQEGAELKACPFCGSEARAYSRDNRPAGFCQHEVDHWIDCTSDECLAHQGMAETAEQAARLWNTRTGEKA